MFSGVENCWRIELADRADDAWRYVGSRSTIATRPPNAGIVQQECGHRTADRPAADDDDVEPVPPITHAPIVVDSWRTMVRRVQGVGMRHGSHRGVANLRAAVDHREAVRQQPPRREVAGGRRRREHLPADGQQRLRSAGCARPVSGRIGPRDEGPCDQHAELGQHPVLRVDQGTRRGRFRTRQRVPLLGVSDLDPGRPGVHPADETLRGARLRHRGEDGRALARGQGRDAAHEPLRRQHPAGVRPVHRSAGKVEWLDHGRSDAAGRPGQAESSTHELRRQVRRHDVGDRQARARIVSAVAGDLQDPGQPQADRRQPRSDPSGSALVMPTR